MQSSVQAKNIFDLPNEILTIIFQMSASPHRPYPPHVARTCKVFHEMCIGMLSSQIIQYNRAVARRYRISEDGTIPDSALQRQKKELWVYAPDRYTMEKKEDESKITLDQFIHRHLFLNEINVQLLMKEAEKKSRSLSFYKITRMPDEFFESPQFQGYIKQLEKIDLGIYVAIDKAPKAIHHLFSQDDILKHDLVDVLDTWVQTKKIDLEKDGNDLLEIAIYYSKASRVIKYLVDTGIDVDAPHGYVRPLRDAFRFQHDPDVLSHMIDASQEVRDAIRPARRISSSDVRLCFAGFRDNNGHRVGCCGDMGLDPVKVSTPILIRAIQNDNIIAAKMLIEKGCGIRSLRPYQNAVIKYLKSFFFCDDSYYFLAKQVTMINQLRRWYYDAC